MAAELGVCWDSVMAAVREHGEPLVEDPDRVGVVAQLGVDETTVLAANADHPTLFATGMVDLRTALSEGAKTPPCLRDLPLLAAPRWVRPLVVAV